MGCNKKKAMQLGMAYGTACNRLRKKILFYLICRNRLNICYRCKKEITKEEDFSIDHKQSWLDSVAPLDNFFDLKNITFSHLGCNSGNRRMALTVANKHGFKGVRHDPRNSRRPWIANYFFNYRKIHIGCYGTAKEAARAYDKKTIEAFGDLAVTNASLGLL